MLAALLVIVSLSALAVFLRKLSPLGGLSGALVAFGLYLGLGYAGLLLLGAFFILGTAASSFRKHWKADAGLLDNHRGRRAAQVWANGGVAAFCGLAAAFAWSWQQSECAPDHTLQHLLQLAAAAALSSATADTLASELGNVWGRRYINIRSLRPDVRGIDGAISLEGTLAGLAGSTIIALLYFYGLHRSLRHAAILVAAGTFGNLADSWLGATLQRKGVLSNDAVNALNTLLAALFAMGIAAL